MAADAITLYKAAYGSGEAKFFVRVGADNNTNTTKTRQPEIVKVTLAKDISDQLHADTLTALRAKTIGDLIDAVYGSS